MIRAVIFDCFGVLYVHEGRQLVRNDALLNFIATLRPHYKVALLSNVSQEAIGRYFTPAERDALFDATVISGDVGMLKPDPEIFAYTCRQLEVEPDEALMIDDAERNCTGAIETGLQAVQYRSFSQLEETLKPLLGVE